MALLLQIFVAGLLSWLVTSSVSIYPHSLSYFNESIGGPLNGPESLLGSNVDWGQDLYYLSWWIEKNVAAADRDVICFGFAAYPVLTYLGSVQMGSGSDLQKLVSPPDIHVEREVQYAISANFVFADSVRNAAAELQALRPKARLAYSIMVF